MRRQETLPADDKVEIARRDWIICGLLWVGAGTLALAPLGFAARVGRDLFVFILIVHTVEALYTMLRAWRQGFGAQLWFLRTIVLGGFAVLALEVHLRKAARSRVVE